MHCDFYRISIFILKKEQRNGDEERKERSRKEFRLFWRNTSPSSFHKLSTKSHHHNNINTFVIVSVVSWTYITQHPERKYRTSVSCRRWRQAWPCCPQQPPRRHPRRATCAPGIAALASLRSSILASEHAIRKFTIGILPILAIATRVSCRQSRILVLT